MTWSFRGRGQISAAGSGVCGKWRPSAVPTITQPSGANYCAGSRAERPTDPNNPDICAEGEFEKICRRNGQEHARGFLTLWGCLHSRHGWQGERRGEVLWQGGRTWFFHSQMLESLPFSLKMGGNGRMARQLTNLVDKQCGHLLCWNVAASVK